jgi:hypothetical protein
MDAVTYPQKAVEEFLAGSMVALRIPSDHPLAKEFKVSWTPTLVTLDWSGQEHHRTVGFLPAEELVASLMLGCAKVYSDLELFDRAFGMLGKLLSAYPAGDAVPEAIFVRGVCGYKSTHNPKPLKDAYEQLEKQYPQSEWTKRAYPYRLL